MTDFLLPNSHLQASPALNFKEDLFESESTTSSSDASTTQNSLDTLTNNDLIQNILKPESATSSPAETSEKTSYQSHSIWKVFIVCLGLFLMFSARFSVPHNDVQTLKDNVLDYLLPINNWIHNNSNSFGPKILLFCCATNMDLIFFITVFYWFKYGKTSRLVVALSVFYLVRTAVQQMSFQPFPKGYYWDSPGFPSFVAPYGRSTDFFFSGHSGFLVLMQSEWGALGYKKIQRYIQANLIYTIFVLLVCQAHYSIDIFTGVFFADYVFGKVDANKDAIDGFFQNFAESIEKLLIKMFSRKAEKKEE